MIKDEDGNIKVVLPGDDGYAKLATSAGTKRVSFVQKDGKRTKPQKVKTKRGKNKIGRKKPKAETPKETPKTEAVVSEGAEGGESSEEPKVGHWKLISVDTDAQEFSDEDGFKEAELPIVPGRFRVCYKETKDTYSNAHSGSCKGEYFESTVSFTEPKKYYLPEEKVSITYSTSTSCSKYACNLTFPMGIHGNVYTKLTDDMWDYRSTMVDEEHESHFEATTYSIDGDYHNGVGCKDVGQTVRGEMPDASYSGDTVIIELSTSTGLKIYYRYVWVEPKKKK